MLQTVRHPCSSTTTLSCATFNLFDYYLYIASCVGHRVRKYPTSVTPNLHQCESAAARQHRHFIPIRRDEPTEMTNKHSDFVSSGSINRNFWAPGPSNDWNFILPYIQSHCRLRASRSSYFSSMDQMSFVPLVILFRSKNLFSKSVDFI